jgi:type II secretory pathway pseudopilin PulG
MTITQTRRRRAVAGFTLVETVVAILLVGITFLATFAAISFSRVQMYRDKELGIATGFCVHYLELVRALPFREVARGSPLNGLYSGGPNAVATIRIPTNSTWGSLDDADYLTFDPDLAWLAPHHAELRVDLDTTQANGVDHTKHISVHVRWEAPFGQGRTLTTRMDMIRVKDL